MEPDSGIPVHTPPATNPPSGAAGGGGTNPPGSPAIAATGCWLIIAMMPATMATTPPATQSQMPMPSEMEK